MRLLARARPPAEGAQTVASWGVDPVGAAKMDSILARSGALQAGFTTPTPAGWGLAGSVETTDQSIWASPQAFTAAGGANALATWSPGADTPTVYPQSAHIAITMRLPGPGGV